MLSALIALVFMPVNFKFMEWNSAVTLTDWMTEQEENLERVTQLLTTMDNFGEFVLAMTVVAILPAIGEELLFRGLIQNKLQLIVRNSHLAIWITAILFSAIHFQFYGFVPRMVLGALFGYLYVWSGNLWIPIVGHFINNGIQILLLYVYQRQVTELNIDEIDTIPWGTFIIAAVATVALLYYFYRKANDKIARRWQAVYTTSQMHQAEIVKGVLAESHLDPVIINKKDTAYNNFGVIEVQVASDQAMEAIDIINKKIQFD
jgi:membrane protease YdiL (CAAX protease family)